MRDVAAYSCRRLCRMPLAYRAQDYSGGTAVAGGGAFFFLLSNGSAWLDPTKYATAMEGLVSGYPNNE